MTRRIAALLVAVGLLAASAAHADPVHVVVPDDYGSVVVYATLVNSASVGPDMRPAPGFALVVEGQFATGGDLLVFDLPATVGECYRAILLSGLGISFASSREVCVTANGPVSGS